MVQFDLCNRWNGKLAGAYLAVAYLTDAVKDEEIPAIPKIDAVILAEIERGGTLAMDDWHGPENHWCGTTHCRAGWAIHCAGELGKKLEDKIGPQAAAALIYQKSRPGVRHPNFFATHEDAMADLRKCAAEQNAEEFQWKSRHEA
jgi:hypothetical protein